MRARAHARARVCGTRLLGAEAVDPVGNVERAVGAEAQQVPGRDVLGALRACHEHELREHRHGLEVLAEGPARLEEVVQHARAREQVGPLALVQHQREHGAGRDAQQPVRHLVVRQRVLLVRHAPGPAVHAQRVDDGAARQDVEELHGRVVHAVEAEEEVQVARHEDQQVQLLRLERDACGQPGAGGRARRAGEKSGRDERARRAGERTSERASEREGREERVASARRYVTSAAAQG